MVFNKNSSLSIDYVNHLVSFVEPSFVSTFLSTSFFDSSCSTMYCCVLVPDLQIYNISSDEDQLTYYEQQVLDKHLVKLRKMRLLHILRTT